MSQSIVTSRSLQYDSSIHLNKNLQNGQRSCLPSLDIYARSHSSRFGHRLVDSFIVNQPTDPRQSIVKASRVIPRSSWSDNWLRETIPWNTFKPIGAPLKRWTWSAHPLFITEKRHPNRSHKNSISIAHFPMRWSRHDCPPWSWMPVLPPEKSPGMVLMLDR